MIQIRVLQPEDDFHDLVALSRDFFQEYEGYHEEFFKIDQLEEASIVAYFSRWLNADDGQTFIAVAGDRIVGYITVHVREQAPFWKVKKVGDISGLMVHRDYRQQGIASQLLARARAFFAGHAVEYFTLFTAVGNQAAIAFYEHHGLVPLHTTMIGVSDTGPRESTRHEVGVDQRPRPLKEKKDE